MHFKHLFRLILIGLLLLGAPLTAQEDDGEATPEAIPGIIITTEENAEDEAIPGVIITEDESEATTAEAEETTEEPEGTTEDGETILDTSDESAEDEEESSTPELGVVTLVLFGILGVAAAGFGLIGREQQYGEDASENT